MNEYFSSDRSRRDPSALGTRFRLFGLAVSLVIHVLLVLALFSIRISVKVWKVEKEKVQTVVLGPSLKYPLSAAAGGLPAGRTGLAENTMSGIESPAAGSRSSPQPSGNEGRGREAAGPEGPAGGGGGGQPAQRPEDAGVLSRKFQESVSGLVRKNPSGLYFPLGLSGAGGRGPATGDDRKGLRPEDLLQGLPGASGLGRGYGSGGPGGIPGGTSYGRPGAAFRRRRVGISMPSKGVDLTPWAEQVVATVQNNWRIPTISEKLAGSVKARFNVIIKKSGEMESIEILDITRLEALDQAAMAAIRASLPFAALPDGFQDDFLEILFEFTYND